MYSKAVAEVANLAGEHGVSLSCHEVIVLDFLPKGTESSSPIVATYKESAYPAPDIALTPKGSNDTSAPSIPVRILQAVSNADFTEWNFVGH